jgi:hypothetical protein
MPKGLDWDHACAGNQASDLAPIATTIGWPLARQIDARRRTGSRPLIADSRIIAATFASRGLACGTRNACAGV